MAAEARAAADAARREKLVQLQQHLMEQVQALRTGEDWQRWLSGAARLHTYSFHNTLLILAARPDATTVAGYQTWKTLGRHVLRGEPGIPILAPIVRRRDTPSGNEAAEGGAHGYVAGYRVTHVWDVAQTTGNPLPAPPRPELLIGEAPSGLWDALAQAVTGTGFTVERGPVGTANGMTDAGTRRVRIRADLDDAQAVKTLAHELGHIRMHVPVAASGGTLVEPVPAPVPSPPPALLACRGAMEVEAESVAFLVTAMHGLDAGGYTFPYVAAWADGVPGHVPADVVRATGERVLSTARWVLQHTEHLLDGSERELPRGRRARTTSTLRERTAERDAKQLTGTSRHTASRDRLVSLHTEALLFYRGHLGESWAPDYLASRRLSAALGDRWQTGYAPRGWTALIEHLRGLGADDPSLLEAGLAVPARNGRLIDRFRDRLMFPIRDADGDTIGFVGRAHPDVSNARVPKYLNSPATELYRKAESLFGLYESRDALAGGARPALVEGPLDAIAVTVGTDARCAGVASCGTAVTDAHLEQLARSVDLAERGLVVAADNDEAGQAVAYRLVALLAGRGLDPTAAVFAPNTDPADLLATAGPSALTAALLDRAVPLAEQVIDRRIDGWAPHLQWAEGRVGAARAAAEVIAVLPPETAVRQIERCVGRLGVDREALIDLVVARSAVASAASWPACRSRSP